MTDVRTAQITVESFDGGAPQPRTAQLTVETFDTQPAAEVRVAQLWVEVFASAENEGPSGHPWMLAG